MKKYVISFLVIGFIVAACSFRAGKIRVSEERIVSKIFEGDAASLRGYDFSSLDFKALVKKRPGAAYYLGCRLADLGLEDEALDFFTETYKRDSEPWKRESGLMLAKYYEKRGFGAEELSFMNDFRSRYPGDGTVGLIHLEALLAAGRHETVLRELSFLGNRGPEELLVQAKAEKGSGSVAWTDTFRALFLSIPSDKIHVQAYDFLKDDEEARSAFARHELAFFRAKSLLAQGDAFGAFFGFGAAGAEALGKPAVLWDYGSILERTGKYREGIARIERLLPSLDTPSLLVAEYALGRLHRAAGNKETGVRHFEKALLVSDLLERSALPVLAGASIGDRVLWSLFDAKTDESFGEKEGRLVAEELHRISDPAYFSDYFENLGSILVRNRAWSCLEKIHAAMRGKAAPEDSARFAFLLAVAEHAGLHVPSGPGAIGQRSLLEEASAHGAPYYRILASIALGERMPVFETYAAPKPILASAAPEDKFVLGFVDFHLPERGLDSARSLLGSLSPETLAHLARNEAAKGKYIESLRLLHIAVRREDARPSRSTLETLYPLAFREEMEEALEGVKLPEPLFYGLIREESYFDATIRSQAGAVGLSQLMPSTAAEIAARIGIENPELTDPKVNLMLGSRYLANLLDNLGSGVYGLAGYNAGGGRVLQWKRRFRGLPETLFSEAIPYEETREYIRKVLVSAVFYGHLYLNMRPFETVPLVYEDFFTEFPAGKR